MAREPKQIIDIPELNNEQGAAKLELSTRKYSNGQIVSAAHVSFCRDGMMVFELYGDFSKTMLRIKGRATHKERWTLNMRRHSHRKASRP